MLVQADTPDRLLAAPADVFVERFVGEDRALRRLALRRLDELDLARDGAAPDAPRAPAGMSARGAVSLMLETGAPELVVVGDDGAERGVLRLDRVRELLA